MAPTPLSSRWLTAPMKWPASPSRWRISLSRADGFQLERIPAFQGGTGSFYYHAWMPPGTVWHQEDASALLSPDLYESFIEPCDRRIVAAFPHVVMHQHSTGFVPTDAYLDMGMSAMELHIDSGGPPAARSLRTAHGHLGTVPARYLSDIPAPTSTGFSLNCRRRGSAIITVVDGAERRALFGGPMSSIHETLSTEPWPINPLV